MKQLSALIFLFFSCFAFTQEVPDYRYNAGVFVSPDFTFPANTQQEGRGYASYSFGAYFHEYFGAKSRVGLGVTLSSRQILTDNVTFNSNYDPFSQTFDTTFSYVTNKQFVQVPLRWSRYVFQRERFGLYVTAGLSLNLQYREEVRWRADPESGERIKNYTVTSSDARVFGVNPFIGGGVEVGLTENLLLAVQPEYAFYFLKDSDYTLQTVGVGFLLSYRF